jgi:hypothetical protein
MAGDLEACRMQGNRTRSEMRTYSNTEMGVKVTKYREDNTLGSRFQRRERALSLSHHPTIPLFLRRVSSLILTIIGEMISGPLHDWICLKLTHRTRASMSPKSASHSSPSQLSLGQSVSSASEPPFTIRRTGPAWVIWRSLLLPPASFAT